MRLRRRQHGALEFLEGPRRLCVLQRPQALLEGLADARQVRRPVRELPADEDVEEAKRAAARRAAVLDGPPSGIEAFEAPQQGEVGGARLGKAAGVEGAG